MTACEERHEGACNRPPVASGHGTSMAHPPPSDGVRRHWRTQGTSHDGPPTPRRPAVPDFQAGHAGSIPVTRSRSPTCAFVRACLVAGARQARRQLFQLARPFATEPSFGCAPWHNHTRRVDDHGLRIALRSGCRTIEPPHLEPSRDSTTHVLLASQTAREKYDWSSPLPSRPFQCQRKSVSPPWPFQWRVSASAPASWAPTPRRRWHGYPFASASRCRHRNRLAARPMRGCACTPRHGTRSRRQRDPCRSWGNRVDEPRIARPCGPEAVADTTGSVAWCPALSAAGPRLRRPAGRGPQERSHTEKQSIGIVPHAQAQLAGDVPGLIEVCALEERGNTDRMRVGPSWYRRRPWPGYTRLNTTLPTPTARASASPAEFPAVGRMLLAGPYSPTPPSEPSAATATAKVPHRCPRRTPRRVRHTQQEHHHLRVPATLAPRTRSRLRPANPSRNSATTQATTTGGSTAQTATAAGTPTTWPNQHHPRRTHQRDRPRPHRHLLGLSPTITHAEDHFSTTTRGRRREARHRAPPSRLAVGSRLGASPGVSPRPDVSPRRRTYTFAPAPTRQHMHQSPASRRPPGRPTACCREERRAAGGCSRSVRQASAVCRRGDRRGDLDDGERRSVADAVVGDRAGHDRHSSPWPMSSQRRRASVVARAMWAVNPAASRLARRGAQSGSLIKVTNVSLRSSLRARVVHRPTDDPVT